VVRRRYPTSVAVIALIALTSGCGRIGYEPLARVVVVDSGPEAALDMAAGDSGDSGPAVDAMDMLPADQRPPDTADAPAAPDVGPEAPVDVRPVDLPPDVAPAASPTGANGTTLCFDYPAPRDLLADFEAGTPTLIPIDGRSGNAFHLVQTGAGEIGIINNPALGACGSSGFMAFVGRAIPAGSNGHIQVQFVAGPTGSDRFLDARAFSGIRLTLRSSSPLSVSLKLPDSNTIADVPYDHFSATLNVVNTWRTYVIPFSQFRQSGVGTRQPALNLAQLFALELRVSDRDFDLQVDTIAFTR
jgi:hypothetical protein